MPDIRPSTDAFRGLPDLGPDVRVVPGARLSEVTTFRLGGPCRVLVDCPDRTTLGRAVAALRAAQTPFLLIGGGSNLLVSDAGVDAVVLRCPSNVA